MLTAKILAADQYTETIPRIKIRKNGERVVADRELTISYIYNAYYWYASNHLVRNRLDLLLMSIE